MSEMIVKLNENHVKFKGCEYIQDLIRCEKCGRWDPSEGWTTGECDKWNEVTDGTDFCSYAKEKE